MAVAVYVIGHNILHLDYLPMATALAGYSYSLSSYILMEKVDGENTCRPMITYIQDQVAKLSTVFTVIHGAKKSVYRLKL